MSVETWARTAYHHAKVTLVIGANNNPANLKRTGKWSDVMVTAGRRKRHWWVKQDNHWVPMTAKTRYDYGGADAHERELKVAERASEYRAGNCGEHAAVVYAFLYERAANIGYVSRFACDKPGDHAFVVINRRPLPGGKQFAAFWGPDSIVVDPWWGVICSGSDLAAANGGCLFAEEGINPEDMQDYVKTCGCTCKTEFDTGAPG